MTEPFYHVTQEVALQTPWLLPLCFALFGACVGSFLNVVIYRLPRGLSVHEPRRSFCPACKAPIPWYHNIPLVSWLLLRGRSACCGCRISPRYWWVELGTSLLFALLAWRFSEEGLATLISLCAWASLMLALLCIDWEQMIVLPGLAVAAAALGCVTSVFSPWLVEGQTLEAGEGLLYSFIGAGSGYVLFRFVALLGRLFFGRRRVIFPEPVVWTLRQEGEDLAFVAGERRYSWSELFLEDSHSLTLTGATLEGHSFAPGKLLFRLEQVELPGGEVLPLEECDSLSGTCAALEVHREAMGSGDAWLALGIGALCGWQGVLFALVAGSLLGCIWAVAARVGRGQPMPFGPALIAGAFLWLFYGHILLYRYLDWCESLTF